MGRDGRGVKSASQSSIEITFTYRGVRCRERLPLKPTPANLKRAEQHRAAILHAIATNSFDYAATFPTSTNATKFAEYKGEVQLLGDYLEQWLDRRKPELKASAYDGYRKIVDNKLIPWFGQLRLAEIKRSHIREILSQQTCTNKTLANIQSPLRKALDDAAEDELIEANPMAGWTYSKQDAPKKKPKIDPFSKEEQKLILDAATGQAKNLLQFALWTGLRTSEYVALNWEDVDFVRSVIIVDKALTQKSDEAETTKTISGLREVKLLAPALEAIIAQKQHTYLAGQEVFQNPATGERWTGDQPIRKRMFEPLLKKAKVRYRNPYQTRHTYASMMLSAGEHPMWVAKQMGHADWTMIARVYGKWMPDADTGAGSKAESLFGNDNITPTIASRTA
ncbi:site-specific integrase [Undibacterium sp. CY21W]|uniref:tyrosine-type recombinase/integrase n=1 Tax=Undibacterium sp. CY21W TaxID=2762293 RepID=UPI00164A1DDD|nr:site-specific integrase [Undibacterium sp. CY21W]MBC3927811.1 site-specific integrase [Undibacterium sp. CY21W]